VLLRPITAIFAPTWPENVFGCLPAAGNPRSIENTALAARAMEWAEQGMCVADAPYLPASADCDDCGTVDQRFARAATRTASCFKQRP